MATYDDMGIKGKQLERLTTKVLEKVVDKDYVTHAKSLVSNKMIDSQEDNDKPWHIVARTSGILSSFSDNTIILHIYSKGYQDEHGIVQIRAKVGGSTITVQDISAKWLVRQGISEDSIAVCAIIAGTTIHVDVFFKCSRRYQLMTFTSIGEYMNSGAAWELYDSTSSQNAYVNYDVFCAQEYGDTSTAYPYVSDSVDGETDVGGNSNTVDGYHVVVGSIGNDPNTIYFW